MILGFIYPSRARFTVDGVAFADETEGNFFTGKFRADPLIEFKEGEGLFVAPTPPEPGDTGVGNGTQT
jgi:hypothetical protein